MSIRGVPERHCPASHGATPQAKERTMEYMLLIHSETDRNAEAVPEAARNQMLAAYRAYTEALQHGGLLRGSNRLRPASSGTAVRMRNGKTEVHNGPYIETREELGG